MVLKSTTSHQFSYLHVANTNPKLLASKNVSKKTNRLCDDVFYLTSYCCVKVQKSMWHRSKEGKWQSKWRSLGCFGRSWGFLILGSLQLTLYKEMTVTKNCGHTEYGQPQSTFSTQLIVWSTVYLNHLPENAVVQWLKPDILKLPSPVSSDLSGNIREFSSGWFGS